MELVIRDEKNELCISHEEGSIGFTVLTEDDKQLDFNIEIRDWEQLQRFISDSIYDYQESLKDKSDS